MECLIRFFFSSRRRHTRCGRDWSSDVCSSDLLGLALWTLPFLWIGFGMSVRRAADAGRSAWWALLFFVPVLNYVLMVTLSLLPTAAVPEWRQAAPAAVM